MLAEVAWKMLAFPSGAKWGLRSTGQPPEQKKCINFPDFKDVQNAGFLYLLSLQSHWAFSQTDLRGSYFIV